MLISCIDKCIFIGSMDQWPTLPVTAYGVRVREKFWVPCVTFKRSGPSKHRGLHFTERKKGERGNQSGPFDHCLDGPDCRQVPHVILTRHPKTWSTEYQPQIYGVIIQCFCGGSGSSPITGENNLIPAIPLQWLLFETVHVLMLVENVKYTKTVLDLGLVHP